MNSHPATPNRSVGKTILTAVLFLAALALSSARLSATTYYCNASTGSDSNSGLSTTAAFQTIQKAANLILPGDTVLIMNGTYTDVNAEGVLQIYRSGAAGANITFKAYPGHAPVLHSTVWNCILICGSYVVVDGLICEGNNDNITMSQAMAVYNYYQANKNGTVDWAYVSTTSTNGVFIRSEPQNTGPNPHHITVQNCTVRKCGGGLGTVGGDYITFQNNISHSNCWYSIWAGSGISVNAPKAFDTNTSVYKIIVQNNIVYDNECYVPWESTSAISDGNGIIYDSGDANNYKGKALYANNISYENGGSGLHGYNSTNLTIVNNTLYNNVRSPDLSTWPQFGLNGCTTSSVRNNIVYGRSGRTAAPWTSTGCVMDSNLYFNTPVAAGTNNIVADPKFVNLSTKDFHLQQTSLGMDTGSSTSAPATDIAGTARPLGFGYDRGAYEQAGNNPPAQLPGAFALLTPSNGSRNQSRTNTVFDWQDASGATTYAIVVDNNSDFSSPVINVSGLTASTYTSTVSLGVRTTYYWKVTATNAAGSTQCTTVFNFKTN